MTDEVKVKELPQEEQDAILKEAQELEIKGILPEFTVVDLKQKIEEAKNSSSEVKKDQEQNQNSVEDNSHDEVDGHNPYKDLGYQAVKAEVLKRGLETADNKGATLEAALIADDRVKNAISAEVNSANSSEETKEIKDDGLCVVCLQHVFNGKCSGCGRVFS